MPGRAVDDTAQHGAKLSDHSDDNNQDHMQKGFHRSKQTDLNFNLKEEKKRKK